MSPLRLLPVALFAAFATCAWASASEINFPEVTEGELVVLSGSSEPALFGRVPPTPGASLPLKHTSAVAKISGFVARTVVTQEFGNPYGSAISAVYRFPLPHGAAVDGYEMTVAGRATKGVMKKRAEARQEYEQAVSRGQTAALLDQERPNIFSQTIGNILPGDSIVIKISYVEELTYASGSYEYVFPMVVGPRYNPPQVTDAANIESPSIPAGFRGGHTVSVDVELEAGVSVEALSSASHDVDVVKASPSAAKVSLRQKDAVPNKDFSLTYRVAGSAPKYAFVTETASGSDVGHFLLTVQPPTSATAQQRRAKEIIFVLDTSGSMQGRPINTVKSAMKAAIADLTDKDAFNIVTFNNAPVTAWAKPISGTDDNKRLAQEYVNNLQAGGGTNMVPAFQEALKVSGAGDRLRLLVMMTDGDVGNEQEVLKTVKTGLGSNRVFLFGVDAASNRYLLDTLAQEGGGTATYVLQGDDPAAKVHEFAASLASPMATNMTIDWGGVFGIGGVETADLVPSFVPDAYAGRPVSVVGSFKVKPGNTAAVVTLRGRSGTGEFVLPMSLDLRASGSGSTGLASLWARRQIDALYRDELAGKNPDLEKNVTEIALKYSIMSAFTSFVAVDDRVRNEGTPAQQVQVLVYEVDGKDMYREQSVLMGYAMPASANAPVGANANRGGAMFFGAEKSMSAQSSYGLLGANMVVDSVKGGTTYGLASGTSDIAEEWTSSPIATRALAVVLSLFIALLAGGTAWYVAKRRKA